MAPVAVALPELELDALAGLPAVRLDIRRLRRVGAVVTERFLAVREVEPDLRAAGAIGEANAGLPERRALARDQATAAGEHRGRRATVRAERPRVGFHPLDVDVAR